MLGNISLQNKSIMTFFQKEKEIPVHWKALQTQTVFPFVGFLKKVKTHLNKNQLQWPSYFDGCLIDAPPNQTTSARCLGYSF